MAASKFTTTPSPIEVVEKVNAVIDDVAGKLSTSGTAAKATILETARTIQTNLGSTSTASFNGSANITPGVTGTLPIANGGTGATTAANARTNLGLSAAITDASINGKTITLTFVDGTTKTLTTQDSTGSPLPTTSQTIGQFGTLNTNAYTGNKIASTMGYLPSGGTWAWFCFYTNNGGEVNNNYSAAGISAGGTRVNGGASYAHSFAWRIA